MMDASGNNFGRTFGEEPPPPHSKRFYPVLSPRPGMEVVGIITSSRPLSAWKHFVEGQSYPCTRDDGCPFCKPPGLLTPRWMAYLAGCSLLTGRASLIELTAGAVHSCPQLRDHNFDLRGKIITLARKGRSPNSPVTAAITEPVETIRRKTLPLPFNIRDALLRMWGNPFGLVNPESGQADQEPPESFCVPC